ncbi:MAG: hypothetical protein ACKVHE_30120 [Planctomycetales bacterium]
MVKRNLAAPAFRQKLSQVDANTVLLHETTQRRTPLLSTVAPATAKGIPRIDQQLSIGGNYTSSPSLRLKANLKFNRLQKELHNEEYHAA